MDWSQTIDRAFKQFAYIISHIVVEVFVANARIVLINIFQYFTVSVFNVFKDDGTERKEKSTVQIFAYNIAKRAIINKY